MTNSEFFVSEKPSNHLDHRYQNTETLLKNLYELASFDTESDIESAWQTSIENLAKLTDDELEAFERSFKVLARIVGTMKYYTKAIHGYNAMEKIMNEIKDKRKK